MPSAMKSQDSSYVDYIGNYERAIQDVVNACGGREQANNMLGELREKYEQMNIELKELRRKHSKDPEKFATEKVKLLSNAQGEVTRIIEKHAPGSADRVRELVFGTSLAMSAMFVPVTYAVSALSVATSIVSVGTSYRKMAGRPSVHQGGFTASRVPSIGRPVKKK